ncbi:MAG: hypothetical protein KF725_00060 [Cyclobacteriaceae bacterium]|nr:hypothetical protein [Cyclobacteriaceae bacterium]UYN87138.1 MAG: hypothetical protein KIT51_02345 [Cyclobacteriaceae bacterium]
MKVFFEWHNEYYFRVILAIIGVVIFVGVIMRDIINDMFFSDPLPYSEVVTIDDEFSGKIKEVIIYKTMARVELVNGKIWRTKFARNVSYNPQLIELFLQKGDQIIKIANNDTIQILRSDSVYYFVFGKTVNLRQKPLHLR